MAGNYLTAITLVLVLLVGWCAVQQLARWFAQRHPELGPFREEGGGCGKHCGCSDGRCQKRKLPKD